MATSSLNRRLAALEKARGMTKTFPSNSDEMVMWLKSLSPQEREKWDAEVKERLRNWELETFGTLVLQEATQPTKPL